MDIAHWYVSHTVRTIIPVSRCRCLSAWPEKQKVNQQSLSYHSPGCWMCRRCQDRMPGGRDKQPQNCCAYPLPLVRTTANAFTPTVA